jgi:DNA replicative helicase MCM subunit Mcm2 (Cdc46/Mcm family)
MRNFGAFASCRLICRLSNTVTVEDAQEAIRLMSLTTQEAWKETSTGDARDHINQ